MRRLFVLFSLVLLQACSTPQQEAEHEEVSLESVLIRGRQVTMQEAQVLYDEGRYEAALTKLSSIVRGDPKNYEAAFMLGESLLRLQRGKDSVGFFTAAKESPQFKAQALQGIGLAYVQMGDYEIAEERLQEALESDPALWRSHNALGQIYDSRQEWTDAQAEYDRALELNPGNAAIHNNRGMSFMLQQRLEPAINEFQEALRLNPSLAPARNNLRMALALNGDYADAMAGVPRDRVADTLNNIGYAAMLRGDYKMAESYFTRAMETSPSYHRKAASNLARVQYLIQRESTKSAS